MDATPNCTPTPEEIKQACEEIREGWSPEKWAAQSGRVEWSVPIQKTPSLNEIPPSTS